VCVHACTQASRSSHVSVLETLGEGTGAVPTFLLRSHLKSWASVLGMGYHQVRC